MGPIHRCQSQGRWQHYEPRLSSLEDIEILTSVCITHITQPVASTPQCITRISLVTTGYNIPGLNNIVGRMVYRRLESTCEQRGNREMYDAVYCRELSTDIAMRLGRRSAVVTSHRSLRRENILEEEVRRVWKDALVFCASDCSFSFSIPTRDMAIFLNKLFTL